LLLPKMTRENYQDVLFEDEPLADGVESVSWLPAVTEATSLKDVKDLDVEAEVLPLFPLGGIVYTPNSEHILNIFEPRYRQMYNDILMNGSKRFVVSMSHPSMAGKFAQYGVLFQLDDLKEVSEQTNDAVKYVCSHKVTGRVKMHRILNPDAWTTRETYLKVEGTIVNEDADAMNDDTSKIEYALKDSFDKLVELQHVLNEDVRFTRESVKTLKVRQGDDDDNLWATIKLWQSYTEQRLGARQNELQKEFQENLIKFLRKERGLKEEELPSSISFEDLSPDLQSEVQQLQKRMSNELQPLFLESTLTMQKMLEAERHEERVNLMRFFIDSEIKRLGAKNTLQGMFTSNSSDEDEFNDNLPINSPIEADAGSTILKDEPDAFQ